MNDMNYMNDMNTCRTVHTSISKLLGRMMLVSGLLLGFAAPGASAAQVLTQERDVSGFTGIVLGGSGDLYITQGDAEALTVSAEQKILDVITTEVRGGVLHIGYKRGSNVRTREEIRFDVSLRVLERLGMSGSGDAYADRLEGDALAVTIAGSSDVEFGEVLVDDVRITISGSGDVELAELDANTFESSISGSGEIEVAGRSDRQQVSVSGSGDHMAADLESRVVTATVVGSGQVEVWATESLDVTVTGSGDVIYRGQPEVSLQVSGSGTVKKKSGVF